MDARQFDRITATMSGLTSRRAALGGLFASGILLLAGADGEAKRKSKSRGRGKGKSKRCSANKERCGGECVNTNTSNKHCGECDNRCASGETCLHGSCYSDDICLAGQQACPNFVRCGAPDSDCFCGTTTGGETVCFQDEAFCEEPRPCQNSSDCSDGRVCVDSRDCCEDFDLPDVPRTCVLPCANLEESDELARSGGRGPGLIP